MVLIGAIGEGRDELGDALKLGASSAGTLSRRVVEPEVISAELCLVPGPIVSIREVLVLELLTKKG